MTIVIWRRHVYHVCSTLQENSRYFCNAQFLR